MKKSLILISLFFLISLAYSQKKYEYPIAPKDATKDIYFEDTISDPYQWMENPNDQRLYPWLEKQKDFIKKLSNKQSRLWELRSQLVVMYNEVRREKLEGYQKQEKKYYNKYEFDLNANADSKSKDLRVREGSKGNYKLLIKAKDYLPTKYDKILYRSYVECEENDLVAVAVSINGSDWSTGYIFDLKTGKKLPYKLENLRGGGFKWHNGTLYFEAYNSPQKGRELLDQALGQKLYRLKVGQDSIPELIYTNPDVSGVNLFEYTTVEDRLFLYHYIKSRDNYYKAISYADLNASNFFPRNFLVYPNEEITMKIAHISNDSIWFRSDWNAPNGKVLLANLNVPNQLSEFIPQYDILLKRVDQLGKGKLACVYMHQGQNIALIFNMKGQLLKRISFPKGKKLHYFYETEDVNFTSFRLASFYHPSLLYQISLDNLEFKPVESLSLPYDVNNIETRYVSYTSKDGTEIPMYITCRKDIKLNGKNPLIISGYGGYGTTVEPNYNKSLTLFLAHGGVLAVPNVRGGGAKGGKWALEGRRLKKQNAIDDFNGAVEYLIKEKYSNPDRILSRGRSHGGMLVAAAMIQRPDLYKAVIAEAGALDMLRFDQFTVGNVNTNINEFGVPSDENDFENLKSYSPLHNIKEGVKYPNLLLITGSSDDRVPPLHSYKFLASMQEKADNSSIYALYLIQGAGHGPELTQNDFEDLLLFKYGFIFDNLDIHFYKNNNQYEIRF